MTALLVYAYAASMAALSASPYLSDHIAASNGISSDRAMYGRQLEDELIAQGIYDLRIHVAVLANAWHESHWNPNVVALDTNGAYSVGILQLNDKGLGHGMTVEARQSVQRTMQRMGSRKYFWNWVANSSRHGVRPRDMAYSFAAKVQRCTSADWQPRADTAKRWWAQLQPRLKFQNIEIALDKSSSQGV